MGNYYYMHHYKFISVKCDLKIFIVYDVQMNVKNNFFFLILPIHII